MLVPKVRTDVDGIGIQDCGRRNVLRTDVVVDVLDDGVALIYADESWLA